MGQQSTKTVKHLDTENDVNQHFWSKRNIKDRKEKKMSAKREEPCICLFAKQRAE